MNLPICRICFLCGSLEPGKDGVGDYTRRLAAAFVRRGIPSIAVALNDRWLDALEKSGPVTQTEDKTEITVYRYNYPSMRLLPFDELQAIMKEHGVTVVSLQYVPNSFDRRALPFGLARQLTELGANLRWHIMFHELWLQDTWRNPKRYAIGQLQCILLAHLLHRLRPVAIHTSISYYKRKLEHLGWPVIERPVHGNFSSDITTEWSLRSVLEQNGIDNDAIIIVFFGTIYAQFPTERFVSFLSRRTKRFGSRFVICTIGKNRNPRGKQHLLAAIAQDSDAIRLLDIGQLGPTYICKAFQEAAFGVCTTSLEFSGKSGSAAAMLESGLKVVGYAKENSTATGEALPSGMIDLSYGDPNPGDLLREEHVQNRLSDTLESILDSLNETL